MKEAEAFAELAARYCEFIEHAERYELAERMDKARVLVLELYRAGLELPAVEPVDGVEAEPSPAQPPSWPGFDRFEYHFETLAPFDVESSIGAGLLSDDLLDIYCDLHRIGGWTSGVPARHARRPSGSGDFTSMRTGEPTPSERCGRSTRRWVSSGRVSRETSEPRLAFAVGRCAVVSAFHVKQSRR